MSREVRKWNRGMLIGELEMCQAEDWDEIGRIGTLAHYIFLFKLVSISELGRENKREEVEALEVLLGAKLIQNVTSISRS